jgi:hypothetical protein
MKLEPFSLILEMGTPFCMPDHPIHLDGLVAYCIGSRWDMSKYDDINEKMKEFIEFDDDLGVFKASVMTMLVTEDIGITTGGIHRPDGLKDKFISEHVSHKKAIITNGGPTKRRFTRRATYFSPFVKFRGVGDGQVIANLMMNHLPGIGSDARTSGAGEIVGIRVIPEDDFTLVTNGLPVRNMPVSNTWEVGIAESPYPVRLIPPYKLSKEILGFGPERVCVELF